MSKTKVTTCTCPSQFQDSEHGRGVRVHNQTQRGFRCTVCGTEKLGGGIDAESEGKKKGKK